VGIVVAVLARIAWVVDDGKMFRKGVELKKTARNLQKLILQNGPRLPQLLCQDIAFTPCVRDLLNGIRESGVAYSENGEQGTVMDGTFGIEGKVDILVVQEAREREVFARWVKDHVSWNRVMIWGDDKAGF